MTSPLPYPPRGRQLPGCPGGPAPSGCSLHNLTGLPRQLHVTVAGSSRFGAIRPYDLILNTKAIGGWAGDVIAGAGLPTWGPS